VLAWAAERCVRDRVFDLPRMTALVNELWDEALDAVVEGIGKPL